MTASTFHPLRPLVGLASYLAPQWTGRLAFRAFCTPHRPRHLNSTAAAVKSKAALAGAHAISVPVSEGSVAAYVFEPSQATNSSSRTRTALLVHGWTGRAAFMTRFVAPLLQQGFRVIAYDQPAHGNSTGALLNIPLGVEALVSIERAFSPIDVIISHSFGGSVALAALCGAVPTYRPISTSKLALISSPSSLRDLTRSFSHRIGLDTRGQAALERRIHIVAGAPVDAFEGEQQLAAIAVPTLILHCRDDQEVRFNDAEALARAGSHVRLQALSGFGHRRILRAQQAVDAVTDFVSS